MGRGELIAASGPAANHLWLRVTAFLSSKAENSKRTYLPILKEWCSFLGGEFGSEAAATKIIEATDLHAAAFIEWQKGQPGMKPRLKARQSAER